MAKIKVAVEVVPLAGKSTKKKVELEATGATVGEVLKKAGVDPTNMTVRVDGKDATLNDHVTSKAKIEAQAQASTETMAPPPRVTVTERPQGS